MNTFQPPKMSKRKWESYQRAIAVAQELRHQLSDNRNWDGEALVKILLEWMSVTENKVKYSRPKNKKSNL